MSNTTAAARRNAAAIVDAASPAVVLQARSGDDARLVGAINDLSATAGKLRAQGDVAGADAITDVLIVWTAVRVVDGRA